MKNKIKVLWAILIIFASVNSQAEDSIKQIVVLEECVIRIPIAYHLVPTFDGGYVYSYRQGDIDNMTTEQVITLRTRRIDIQEKTQESLNKINTFTTPLLERIETVRTEEEAGIKYLHKRLFMQEGYQNDIYYIIGHSFILRGFNTYLPLVDALYKNCLDSNVNTD